MANLITRITSDKLYINAFYLMSTNFLLVGMGFFFWVICARWYSPTEVGLASTIISAVLFLTTISTLGLNWGLIRFLPEAVEKEKGKMINSTFSVAISVSLFSSTLFLLGLQLWSPKLLLLWQSPIFLVLFVGTVIILTLAPLVDSIFVATRNSKLVLYRNAVWSVFKILFPILLIWVGAIGIVGSYSLSALISLLISMIFFIPKIHMKFKFHFRLDLKHIKKIFTFSMGNYIANFLGALPTILFPLIITQIFNPQLTAYFFIAWTMGIIFQHISHAVSISLLVESSHNPEEFHRNIKKAAVFNSLIFLPLIVIFLLLGAWILSIFGPNYSSNGFALLRVLVLLSPLVMYINIYLAIQRVKKDISKILIVMGIIGLGTLSFGFIFLQMWGLVGIGIAWGLSHGFAIIFILLSYYRKRLQEKSI